VSLEKAAVYVPGGTAAYPSSLIMGVVPAKLAGVKEIFVTTPTVNGTINPYVSAAALLLGSTMFTDLEELKQYTRSRMVSVPYQKSIYSRSR
jgi:histidinol dehydrogenase